MAKHKMTRREILSRYIPAIVLATQVSPGWTSLPDCPEEEGFTSIFDGKSLNGWHTNVQKIVHGTGGQWQVENGILTGEQDPPGSGNGGVLMTDKKYGDFELLIDLAPDWGVDSGVFLRTNKRGECFQVYVDYHDKGHVGYISTERDGKPRMFIRPFFINGVLDDDGNLVGFDAQQDERELAWGDNFLLYHCSFEQWKNAWKIGEWNTLRIRCEGKYPKITTWINNTMIAKFDGATSAHPRNDKEELFEALGREGSIGLQVHGGKIWKEGAKCRWKNIRVKEL
jgi:hypothetical protein